jgi:hypothetical protein
MDVSSTVRGRVTMKKLRCGSLFSREVIRNRRLTGLHPQQDFIAPGIFERMVETIELFPMVISP